MSGRGGCVEVAARDGIRRFVGGACMCIRERYVAGGMMAIFVVALLCRRTLDDIGDGIFQIHPVDRGYGGDCDIGCGADGS